jgi:hypothetical protein
MEPVNAILYEIPRWSKKLKEESIEYSREIQSAHNYVTDLTGKNWTFGKTVGDDGDYHRCGGLARKRLESLGFINIYDLPQSKIDFKRKIETNFRKWAHSIEIYDINSRLDRYLNRQSKEKFRLFVPPGLI